MHIYYVQVPTNRLVRQADGTYRLVSLAGDDTERMKKVFLTTFMRAKDAAECTPDPLAGTAIARLIVELYGDVI